MKYLLVILCFLFSLSPLQSYALQQFQTEHAAKNHCPSDVVVWLNLHSGRYHYKGQQWYGQTKVGAFVCKQEVLNEGDRVKRKVYGKGVPQDNKEKLKWYRQSAEQGDAYSQSSLGEMYRDGQGFAQNLVLAYMWLNIATANASNNEKQKRYIDSRYKVEVRLTAKQLAKAQELARKCTANKYKGC